MAGERRIRLKLKRTNSEVSYLKNAFDTPGARHAFEKGHKYGTREYIGEEAYARKLQGMIKAWSYGARIAAGEKVVVKKEIIKKARRVRTALRATLAKEHREIMDLCRTNAEAAANRLADIVNNPSSRDSDAISAANALLDRAYGKATQPNVNTNVDANGKTNEITRKELDSRIEATLARAEKLTGRTAEEGESVERPLNIRKRNRDTGSSSVH